MMKKDYYVTLTGSKNNAGDFLIKYRAFKLFQEFRPDRDIIDYNEWEYLDDEKLQVVNNSKALILLGGPSVTYNTYPQSYKLRKNLDDIKVPIIMMGVGWKDSQGDWENTYNYELSDATLELLKKVNESNFYSSVRDYHTLNALQNYGLMNFKMTGCPAYYDTKFINHEISIHGIKRIAFSLGVSFIESKSMEEQMKSIILRIKNLYSESRYKFEVVFHHSLEFDKIDKVYGKSHTNHLIKHKEFAEWLSRQNINYVDISGSAENLINYYSKIDLHIGYRVHAHIFMNSVSRFSILLNEDGRGKAVKNVIGGIVIDGYKKYKHTLLSRILNKLFDGYSKFTTNQYCENELINNINYEINTTYNRLKISRKSIDINFNIMKNFLHQLP